MRKCLVIAGVLLLAACGKEAPLLPKQGHSLPPKPAMSSTTPTPEDLLAKDSEVNPVRTDEVLRKSERRKPDPFNLPPQE